MKYGKKSFLSILCVLALLLSTGCSSKKLVCTQSEESDGMKVSQKYEISYKKDKATKAKVTMDVAAVSDEAKESWSTVKSFMTSALEQEETDGIKITKKENDKKYTLSIIMDVDVEKAKKEDLEDSSVDGIELSYEDAKKDLEKSGFKCK